MKNIDNLLKSVETWCIPFVCPIYDEHREYPLHGSSILFSHGSRYFMITAAHVLDPINPYDKTEYKNLFIRTNQGYKFLQNLLKGEISNTYHPSGDRNKDNYDFACFEFTEDAISLLNYKFVTIKDINLSCEPDKDMLLVCFGYISDESKILIDTKNLLLETFTLQTRIVTDNRHYNTLKINPETNTIMIFDRNMIISTTNSSHIPSLYGMSGGAVTALFYDENTKAFDIKLDAMGIAFSESKEIIVATRMNTIFNHMRDRYKLNV